MLPDYILRLALIVVLSMTMVNASKANTYTVLISDVTVAAPDCDGFAVAYDHVFPTPAAVLSAFAATFPRTCHKSGVLHYTQYANNFVLTSNTSLTFDVLAIPANEYQGGTPASYGLLKTWTENISVAECPAAGTAFSSGVYDLGTQPLFPSGFLAPCANGCALSFNGGIDKTAVIEGVTHYYATGEYYHDGRAYSDPSSSSCPSGTAVATAMAGAPSASCAPGQNYGTVNGKLVCLNSDGSVSGTDSAEALAAAAAAEADRIKSAAEKARQAAEAEATAAGKTAEEITVAGNAAAAGAAGAAAANVQDDSPLGKFCADNPDAPICIETDYGEVDDVDLENKTIDVAITPVAVSGAGSCPAPSPLVIRGQTYAFEWTTYCNFANGIKPILLAFAWLAAAGIMVGGFRT